MGKTTSVLVQIRSTVATSAGEQDQGQDPPYTNINGSTGRGAVLRFRKQISNSFQRQITRSTFYIKSQYTNTDV